MNALVLALLIALALPFSTPRQADAQEVFTAVAVVNDEVISRLDFEARLRIALLASGLPDTPETINQISGPVLRQLIDERLQRQEAKRLSIEVTEEEMDRGLTEMAQRNGMTKEQFINLLERNGAPLSSILDQIRASISWNKLLSARVVPEVQVSEEEVDQTVERLASQDNQVRVRLAEIFLPFGNGTGQEEARQLAERLISQLAQGTNFQQLAVQFSQAPTAAAGGDTGFIPEAQLAPDLAEVVADMRPGELAGPIPTVNGYYIIAVIDRQQSGPGGGGAVSGSLRLTQILFDVEPGQEEVALRRAEEATTGINSCDAANAMAAEIGVGGSGDIGEVRLANLPQEIRQIAINLPIGSPSQPIFTGDSVLVLFVCDRDVETGGIDRQFVSERLRRERIDMLGTRYMRDLRRAANIEIRL